MISSIQKVVGIGSSDGVTLPAKELRRANIKRGDEIEIFFRPVHPAGNKGDQEVIESAKQILDEYKQDFKNLANR